MPRMYVGSNGNTGCSFGCLGILLMAFGIMAVAILAVALFVRVFWWLLLALAVVMVLAGVVRAIRGPRRRQNGAQGVIEGHVVEDEDQP